MIPGRPWPGSPTPLGASWDGSGTNFAVHSSTAEAVELCLFDDGGDEVRIPLTERSGYVWHGYLPGVAPRQRYGFRIGGPFDPAAGQRHNASKLLLDPYARAICGEFRLHSAVFGSVPGRDGELEPRDSAPYVPRSVVVHDDFDWRGDRPPGTAWCDSVIYEMHVKGFTARHPDIPAALRGTYAGLAHPAAIEHLLALGVTAVQLLPVHHFVSEPHLLRRGLTNYWGYNSVGFFAPHAGYSSSGSRGQQVGEFRAMVRALHEAGLEVLLDVVYNHTGEGDGRGPTLAFRGLDNAGYYRLDPDDPARYRNYAGTGSTLDVSQPHVLQLVMDSLRFWVRDMHVDGFRFDLAPALMRGHSAVEPRAAFLQVVQQDPLLSRVKLVAEPWDIGDGGYQLGRFPAPWAEWNDRFRETARDAWRGYAGGVRELAYRLSGSSDVFDSAGRRPWASVNFVTAHDGFTLNDLVSYDDKHNEANGEGNRDGESHNRSWNHGVEGPTVDAEIVALRARQRRNMLATLLLSQGVPMLLHGDELGRTQGGNNNVYAQDNHVAWVDWERAKDFGVLTEFVSRLARLRAEHPVFRRRRHFRGRPVKGSVIEDIGWFTPAGEHMSDEDWESGFAKSVSVFLNGDGIREPDARGERVTDESFFLLFNGHHEPIDFVLPDLGAGERWHIEIDTAAPMLGDLEPRTAKTGEPVPVDARSVQVLRKVF